MLPPGSCDTHLHFYDSNHPVASGAKLRPPDANPADYRATQANLGLDRLVVVQPTTYGLDNTCQLDAMAAFGYDARGVMVVDETTPTAELARLNDLGVRGARFHMLPGGAVGWDQLPLVADKIVPFGWHVQLQLNGRELADRLDRLRALPVPLVVDHVGRFMPPVDVDHPTYRALLSLIDAGAHVKLSAPYESRPDGSHRYPEVTRLARALVDYAPDRMLWASNWPHPGQEDPPTNADLARLLDDWLPTEQLRRQILVDNPARLYGF